MVRHPCHHVLPVQQLPSLSALAELTEPGVPADLGAVGAVPGEPRVRVWPHPGYGAGTAGEVRLHGLALRDQHLRVPRYSTRVCVCVCVCA